MLLGPSQRSQLPDVPTSGNLADIQAYLKNLDRYLSSLVSNLVNTPTFVGILGISGTGQPANNLRGEVLITGAATSSIVSFMHIEQNTSYMLWLTAHGATGVSLPLVVTGWTGPMSTGFMALVSGAPGVSNFHIVDWFLLR